MLEFLMVVVAVSLVKTATIQALLREAQRTWSGSRAPPPTRRKDGAETLLAQTEKWHISIDARDARES
jgi:hypothetical protein